MAARSLLSLLLVVACVLVEEAQNAVAITLSSRLIHRFSDEAKALRASRSTGDAKLVGRWPQRNTRDYYQLLVNSDFRRQKMKLGSHHQFQFVFPSEGSNTASFGNDFGWCVSFRFFFFIFIQIRAYIRMQFLWIFRLHYTWIDIGTPNVSYLVALDTGSDLLWVPCDCVQCAPLSATYYSNTLVGHLFLEVRFN